ncbi:MAG: FAD-dependent oxidoreductase [Deltaproteobacteria bacterium]|nr:FAD-dependent oxidoreductase [Deltaproteobacteria bacterium]MCL5276640.1 FAD-dependent oxidoreductase [Deltaproteobacteria bacterium]
MAADDQSVAYDVAVIGGGINGTGIARDCAMRGLKVVLFEKNDLSSGATGACTGMIHGGARYLLNDIHTTYLSSLDSGYIQKIAPHLLFRIPFVTPVLKQDAAPNVYLELLETFFEAYDRFAPLKNSKPHTRLTKDELKAIEPGITDDAIGAISFDEYGIDTFRLCVENALSAAEHGAGIHNHTEVVQLLMEGREVRGVRVRDTLTGWAGDVHAKLVMNAAGPWLPGIAGLAGTNVRIRPGKGIHLILDRRASNIGIVIKAIDGRQVFMMPHDNTFIIGTTDDDYYGDLDSLRATRDEIEYLLQAAEHYFPRIREYRIMRVMIGVRPTLYAWGKNEDSLYREHRVFDHETEDGIKGFLTIAGGKLASYRLMSEEATDVICSKLGCKGTCRTHTDPLPGGRSVPDIKKIAQQYSMDTYAVSRMAYRHGSMTEEILKSTVGEASNSALVCECEPVTEAEVRYAVRNEWARTVPDLRRRTRLGTGPCQGRRCAVRAAYILGEELGLGSDGIKGLIEGFIKERWKGNAPILADKQLAEAELNLATHILSDSLNAILEE